MSNDQNDYSDVSLDEEDEALIWRVFYSKRDQHKEKYLEENTEPLDSDSEELSGLSDIDDPELVKRYNELKGKQVDDNLNDVEKQKLLISNLTEEQMEMFEAYRRMTVNKSGIKKVCSSVIGHSLPQNVAIVLAGLSKSFLSEIITRAFEIQEQEYKATLKNDIQYKKMLKQQSLQNIEQGKDATPINNLLQYKGDYKLPLQPDHIREAWRLYKLESSGQMNAQWKKEGEANGWMFR